MNKNPTTNTKLLRECKRVGDKLRRDVFILQQLIKSMLMRNVFLKRTKRKPKAMEKTLIEKQIEIIPIQAIRHLTSMAQKYIVRTCTNGKLNIHTNTTVPKLTTKNLTESYKQKYHKLSPITVVHIAKCRRCIRQRIQWNEERAQIWKEDAHRTNHIHSGSIHS